MVSQDELGNFLDKFKTKFLSNLSKQLQMLRMQDEKKEDVDICVVHPKSHAIKYFPSLQGSRKFTKRIRQQVNHQINYVM